LVVVEAGGRACLATLDVLAGGDDAACRLDQNLRDGLEMPRDKADEWQASLFPVKGSLPLLAFPGVHPRSLLLQVRQPYRLDSERNICVLSEANLRLLGLAAGEYVSLVSIVPASEGGFALKHLNLRVFCGSAKELPPRSPNERRPYPLPNKLYIDLEGRTELGLHQVCSDYPVLVLPNIWTLFRKRLVFYGITLFVGITAFIEVLKAIPFFQSHVAWKVSVAVILSFVLTVAFSVAEMRSQVKY
jgi:hypothetical protein